jgi:hypothetical protein
MPRFVLRFLATMILSIGMASSYGVAPGSPNFSRRHALDRLVGFGSLSLVGLVTPPAVAAETAESNSKPETMEEKKARQLKEKIAASKKNFRKADSYAKERFTTVDYSCVADTGSPCKEPKSVFPSDGKIENL